MKPVPYYDSCGLLTNRAIMAHCIFTDESDRKLILERDAGVSHKPSANCERAERELPLPLSSFPRVCGQGWEQTVP